MTYAWMGGECYSVSYRHKFGGCGLDASGLGWGPVAGSCENDNEALGDI
jgi:hypothetical protein